MNQGLTIYELTGGDTLMSLQVHQKRPLCVTCDNTFISLKDYTLPFMFTRPASLNEITSFEIFDTTDTLVETLDNSLVTARNAGDIDYITCNFQATGEDDLPCGLYYYRIEFDTEVYYSEIFRVIDKDLEIRTEDIAVNGDFATDMSGWTVVPTAFSLTPGANITTGGSISQVAPGDGLVKITVTTLSTFLSGMFFKFGYYEFPILPGVANVYYVPSGVTYGIYNEDGAANDLTISSVVINQAERVECYNLIAARNSCNKNGIPYVETGYQDVFILDAELSEPKYLRDEQVGQNGNKDKSITFLRIDKQWDLNTTNDLYEPLVDELNKLPGNDCIYIFNDIWKKEFSVFEGTLDISIPQPEWSGELKCNAHVSIIITESLLINNSCCEEIENIECCEEIDYEWNMDGDDVTVTVNPEACPGMFLSIWFYTSGVFTESITFTTTITFEYSGSVLDTYFLVGTKLGCDELRYELNVS